MMKFKVTMEQGDKLLNLSNDEIDYQIKNHLTNGTVQFLDYTYDETGHICGIKCFADLGCGYGLDSRYQGFTLRFGEMYAFTHMCTSNDESTDGSDGYFEVVLNMIKIEE